MASTTVEEPGIGADAAAARCPGLVLVFAGEKPRFAVLPLGSPAGPDGNLKLVIGRDELLAHGVEDDRVSRRHLAVAYTRYAAAEEPGGRWQVEDCGSRNGSFLDGGRLTKPWSGGGTRVARIGRTLLLLVEDVSGCQQLGLVTRAGERGLIVLGPALQQLHQRITTLARAGQALLLTGESGTGKEIAAQVFHAATERRGGQLVAVNCATVPRELAERLMFGARRGAYSGAVADSEGYAQAADGGTLFLDEVGELELAVQAKLLRMLETREVTPLGATRARAVDLRLCAATLRDLRAEVVAGRFREDLYFRLGRPELQLLPLRERREEIPWLIAQAVALVAPTLRVAAGLVEVGLLRPWPGNVRELMTEVRSAALTALAGGAETVEAANLDERAGWALNHPGSATEPAAPPETKFNPEEQRLHQALTQEHGNVSRAATRLGIPRIKLRRFIEKYDLDLDALRSAAK